MSSLCFDQNNNQIEGHLNEVKALMLRMAAGSSFERLGAIVQEHLFTGGKRLRARLALASAEALDVPAELAIPWAAACELLHNATLIHDDLQDNDPIRRGHFTVWVRHGQPQAINAGDLLLMLPFLVLRHVPCDDGLRWKLCEAIACRAEATVRGQSLEMSLLETCQWDWATYEHASKGKTSALMALPVHGACLLSGLSTTRSKEISDSLQQLGLLFQIQDDVLDLYGDKGRDVRGGDLRQGRVSALVAEHLTRQPSDEKWLVGLLGQSREATTDQDIDHAAVTFQDSGTLDSVLEYIRFLSIRIQEDPVLKEEPKLHKVVLGLVDTCLRPISHLMKD